MTIVWAEKALLESGWVENVRVDISQDGLIEAIEPDRPAEGHRTGVLLPAPANCHSHAFQRAMAGLTERRGPDASDSFWTWRQLMFRFLDRLTPEHVEAIAAFVQMEMLEAGYSANVEFHYLHHQPGGVPYDNMAEMAERIAAASSTTGMGLTLLPVHYQYGGCDKRALGPGQIRFGNTLDAYAELHARSAEAIAHLPADSRIGVAPHSLRAVAPEDLVHHAKLAGDNPLHMHLAEQIAEVEEIEAAYGKRPVELVLDSMELNERRCFIHCTQMLPHETQGLARSGAVAGLCPITESSLGDGIFDGVRWFENGGAIAIGSDSNIRISLSEELRTLDYSQRFRDHSRAALATPDKSTGRRLFDAINAGGASVSARNNGALAVGKLADMMALDSGAVDLIGRTGDTILDCYVFAGDDRMVEDVWSAGRHMVSGGRHVKREAIVAAYASTMKQLGEAI
ncbi:formiminoglutamate deiminase [Hoeflea sp. IMCC20628]|uniref:formimidoylglutamate deiminase n=1 Tax=Hoeflea sp. IMCC20628 TaxID=1620421 RepID=UPI00063AB28C|nr:formimidoylglutamate deiminase [Hoeflea sp. IMCC20628]AKI01640.1 formiminoglutamate deiminase [Hoeflea sp. IMCC20628]